jgi:argininosuccinate lyase
MPQKKNPDSLELIRGKTGTAIGNLVGTMTTVKGIPSTYNKDLQESMSAMIIHVKSVSDSIKIMNGVISTLKINSTAMQNALSPDMLATDLAEYLVRKGVPFRDTHHISGQVVALAEKKGVPMDKLSLAELQGVDKRFGDDIGKVFNYNTSVDQRVSTGGTSKTAVLKQVQVLHKLLEG